MAQYFEDFSGGTPGTAPGGWSKTLGNVSLSWLTVADAELSNELGVTQSGITADVSHFTWDGIGDDPGRDDVEVVAKVKITTTGTSSIGVFARGVASQDTGVYVYLELNTGRLRARAYDNGTLGYTRFVDSLVTFVAGDFVWLRMRLNGNSIQVRVWNDVNPEPVEWGIDEATQTTLSAAGVVGLCSRYTTVSPHHHVDFVGIGTSGDAAPASLPTTGPLIGAVIPSTITVTTAPEITGSGFGATPSAVLLSPTNDRTNENATAQTIGAGADDEYIPLTGVALPVGAVSNATLYYFVQAQDGAWSTGYSVTLSIQPSLSAPETFDATLDGFSFRFTTDTGNGTAIWAAYATTAERNSASVANIQAEIATPVTSLARGEFTVTTTGVQTVSAITGLGAAQTRYVRVFHDGDVTA